MRGTALDIEIKMRQEVNLRQDHCARGGKRVRIFERLVVAFGHREDRDLLRLAEIEPRRADKIADILNEEDRVWLGRQIVERVPYHMSVEMAAAAGVDLNRGDAGRADALSVERGFLVALDHRDRHCCLQQLDGLDQQRGLPRARARDEIDSEYPRRVQALAILAGVGIVPSQNVLLDEHEIGRWSRCHAIVSLMVMVVLMMIVIVVIVMMFALITATAYAAHDRSSG